MDIFMRRLPAIALFILTIPVLSSAVDYTRDIKPLFKKRCVSCHGPIKQKAGLRVDTGQFLHKGSDDGAVVKIGDGAGSLLLSLVSSHDEVERMPPEGAPLSADEVTLLMEWIDAGAPFPETETATISPKDHWAFQVIRAVPLPQVKDESWARNPIDRFILSSLESKGWKPAAITEPRILLRRAFLDLTGLPPTLEEQNAFAESPDFDALVVDLLSRKSYGERWARHWLDAVRYADTNGYERDAIKPSVWRYRDYVIDSLNADKPYDRFLIEQLAGDELPDASSESVIATSYLRLGPWDDEPADVAADRYDQLDDILNTTSQVMLGLTLACARCHNHKFEPLLQKDYYSMVAIFNPLERPRAGRKELAIPAGTLYEVAALKSRDQAISKLENESAELRSTFERDFLEAGNSAIPEEIVAAFLTMPDKQSAEQKKLVKAHRTDLDLEIDKALPNGLTEQLRFREEQIEQLRSESPDLPLAYAWKESTNAVPETHLLVRGQPGRHGELVQPGPPEILVETFAATFPDPDKRTNHRRNGLANWTASAENPLTARVIVNRVWMHHFGAGLVRTPNDFGLMGEAPTHPELLDWLAHWFAHDAEWSLKKLHRLILTSNTWRMSSLVEDPQYAEQDPQNLMLSHQNNRRLEVEAIRDSILAVSGQLNRKMYGPHTYPSISPQALEGHSDPEAIWKPLDEESASRRTIYAFVKRSLMLPMLEIFDVCDSTQPSPGRRVTTVAPQALALFNGEFANRQARHFATRLRAEAGDDPAKQIDLAYRLALCRLPSEAERERLLEFVKLESLEQLCRVIFNLNEFVYTD